MSKAPGKSLILGCIGKRGKRDWQLYWQHTQHGKETRQPEVRALFHKNWAWIAAAMMEAPECGGDWKGSRSKLFADRGLQNPVAWVYSTCRRTTANLCSNFKGHIYLYRVHLADAVYQAYLDQNELKHEMGYKMLNVHIQDRPTPPTFLHLFLLHHCGIRSLIF